MDNVVVDIVKRNIPIINPVIGNGLAVTHMEQTVQYVHSVIEEVAKNFPAELKYTGCSKCTPEEEFHFATAKKNSKRQFDIAQNNMFLMKFHFSFMGEPLKTPRYIYLPFVTDAGSLFLSGTRYFVTPTLSDTTFSPSEKGVFIRLLRDKLNFERSPFHILVDGMPTTIQVAHSLIYHNSQRNKGAKPSIKANCAVAHYLFCKFGVMETFRKYAGCEPVIGYENEITPDKYPPEEWSIFRSRKIKPAGYGKLKYIGENTIAIALRKDKVDRLTLALIGGFHYVVDHFPDQMRPNWVDSFQQWRILLGTILFGSTTHRGRIIEDIQDHFNSLDDYIDNIIADKLKNDGYQCTDIYDLFVVVLNNIDNWARTAPTTINSMYNKELTVLYNVLYEITAAIFKMYFKLKSASKKGLKERDVEGIMNTQFRPRVIYRITKGHGCVKLESYSGDNKFFGITTSMVPQKNSGSQNSAKERPSLRDSSKRLHASVAEVGGFSNLPKNEPSGRSCINPHLHCDSHGRVLRDPDKVELLDKVQEMLNATYI